MTTQLSQLKSFFASSPDLVEFGQLFAQLHQLINDPTTRATAAEQKMQLVMNLAHQSLLARPTADWTIRPLVLWHEPTKTQTYNVEVMIGQPATGPTTVVMVHHDVITVNNKDSTGQIPLSFFQDQFCGPTIQDNTVHLAALIQSLKKLPTPKIGAFICYFTDHEENGCRGSRALAPILAAQLNQNFPVALIALESTQTSTHSTQIGISHRGKLDAQITSQFPTTNPIAIFNHFLAALKQTQIETEFPRTDLGATTGTALSGEITDQSLWSKIDFRTNELVTPQIVSQILIDQLHHRPAAIEQLLFAQVQSLISQQRIKFNYQSTQITIQVQTPILHPSLYQHQADETVLPVLFFSLQVLATLPQPLAIKKISWGEITKQNSNPITATITTSELPDLDLAQLILQKKWQTPVTNFLDLTNIDFQIHQPVFTDAVAPAEKKILQLILDQMAASPIRLNYMTDIAAPTTLLRQLHFPQVVPLIFGCGDLSRLHQIEQLSRTEIKWLQHKLPQLISTVQAALAF